MSLSPSDNGNPAGNDFLGYELDNIDREVSGRIAHDEAPQWWENPHAIQEHFASRIMEEAAVILNIPINTISLDIGGASWIGDQQDALAFILSGTKNKYLIAADFRAKELSNFSVLEV